MAGEVIQTDPFMLRVGKAEQMSETSAEVLALSRRRRVPSAQRVARRARRHEGEHGRTELDRWGSWTDRRAHPPPAVDGAWWGRSERGSLPDSTSSRQKPEPGRPCLLVPRWVPGGREVHTGGSQCLWGCLTTETSDHGEDRLHRVRMRHLARQRPWPTLPCGGGRVAWRQHRACGVCLIAGPHGRTWGRPPGAALSPVLASGPLSTRPGGGVCHHLNAVCMKQQMMAPQGTKIVRLREEVYE